jgi:hypothetical protein
MLQECILDHMEICVTEAEKRETGALNIRDFYTVYLIETKLVAYPYFWLHLAIEFNVIPFLWRLSEVRLLLQI